jgi:hypothetical protein
MAGIFPEAGVSASAAIQSIPGLVAGKDYVDGCPDRWLPNRCDLKPDPAQLNALVSEIMNVCRVNGWAYDCTRLDNLAQATKMHGIDYRIALPLEESPYTVLTGTDRTVMQGSFLVPNDYHRTIRCLCVSQLAVKIRELKAGEHLDLKLAFSSDNSFSQLMLYTTIEVNNLATPGNTTMSWQPVKTQVFSIPPGGRRFYYRMATDVSAANAFQLINDFRGSLFRAYGVSAHNWEVFGSETEF